MPARRSRNSNPGNSKRAHHNALERKRRDSIKAAYDDLRNGLPPGVIPPKASRTYLLKRTYDHFLRGMEEFAANCRELKRLRREVLMMQEEMLRDGIPIPEHERVTEDPDELKEIDDLIRAGEVYNQRRLNVLEEQRREGAGISAPSSTIEEPSSEEGVSDDMPSRLENSNSDDEQNQNDDLSEDDMPSGSENSNSEDEQSDDDVSDDMYSGAKDDPNFEDGDRSSGSESSDSEEEPSDEDVEADDEPSGFM